MILVTGATGRVGSQLTERLLASGNGVKVLSRSPKKVERLESLGASVCLGDLNDPHTVEAALEECNCLFSIPPNTFNQAAQEIQLFQLAARAGVDRIVKLSSAKAMLESPCHFFRQHALSEQHLKQRGGNFTILRSNSFMQNFLWFAGEMRTKGTLSLPMGDAKTAPVDIRDVVSAASKVLMEDGCEGETYNLTGMERLSLQDIAAKFSAAGDREVTYVDIAPTEFNRRLVEAGAPTWFAEAVTVAWQVARKGRPIMADDIEKVMNNQPLSFNEFVRDYKSKFLN